MWPWAKLRFSLVGITSCLLAVSALADNLQQAINQTIATHPQVLSAESQEDAADQDIQQQKGGYYPSFNVSTADGKETSDNPATRAAVTPTGTPVGSPITLTRQEGHFLLTQMIFDGGNVKNHVAKAKADYQTSTYQVYEAQEALGYDAALAYLTVMQDRELVKVAQQNVIANEVMYKKVGIRYRAGAGTKSDLELSLSRLALAKSEYLQIKGALANDEATYFKVVGVPPGSNLEMPPQPQNIPLTLLQAQQLAVQLNPTLAASKAQIASNVAAVGVAKSAFFPTVTVDLNATFADSLDGVPGYNNDYYALVRMNYNVFRGGSDKAAVAAARYRVVASEQDSQKLQRDIMETVAFAWYNMKTAIKRIPELQVHKIQSYNVWQAYIKQFQLGQRTLFDLLDTQSEYYDADSRLVQALYQERIQRYQLLAAIGELVSTVKNPDFAHEPSNIVYPKSSIKTTSFSVPSETVNNSSTSGASASGNHPPQNSVPQTPAVPAGPITIPSLGMPSSLKNQQNNTNQTIQPNVKNQVIVPASTPSPAPSPNLPSNNSSSGHSSAPTLLMKNDHSIAAPLVNKTEGYHLQLLASQHKDVVEQYVKKYPFMANKISIQEHTVRNKAWYALSYGNFPTIQAAKAAQQDLINQLHGVRPIIIKDNPAGQHV